ncbi:ABC transporter permease [Olivibacter sitiensis]|uniref:ABC transporter permease n=1 Tax=Olivibacter sitiensis TaxID=376470 RepID=UPI0003FFEA0D|nr:ABC transporter permease [Olivibacter sitiensis]
MIKNYFKIAIRNLWKHRLFTAINVLSLVLCLTSVIGILLLVNKLVTFDDFHEKGDRLYALEEGNKDNALSPGTVFPIAKLLQTDFPEVEKSTRTLTWDTYILKYGGGDWSITPDFVDPDFLEMFTFPLLYGNEQTALNDVNSIVLSDELAQRIFGKLNPVGREIQWNDSLRLTVTGVLKKLPGASSLQFSALMPVQWLYMQTPYFRQMADGWENRFVTSYVLLKEGVNREAFERKLNQAAGHYFPRKDLEPQLGILLYRDITPRYEPQINYYIGGLRLIVIFLVLIASVNLINLSSAAAFYRIREVGVRNVLGSFKRQIMALFLTETFLLVSMALAISLSLIAPLIRYFNRELLTEFSVDFIWHMDYPVVLQVCLLFILLAFISAWIPAKRLLRTPVALALKGKASNLPKRNPLQQGLIVLQFALAVVFVFLTVTVQQQMRYMKNANLGFDKDQVMVVDTYLGFKDREKAYQSLDQAIRQLADFQNIQHYTTSQNIPGQYRNWFNTYTARKDQADASEVYCRVSYDLDSAYFPTYGIDFLAGTNFHDPKALAKTNAVILNRRAALAFGWQPEEAIGESIYGKGETGEAYTVIGVTADFNYRALNSGIEPLAHFGNNTGAVSMQSGHQFLSIRIDPTKAQPVVQYLRNAFAQIPATGTFAYSYSNEVFDKQYEREDVVMTLIATAGAIAIFVACAGTFGLTAQLARLRTKEIGVRKVLGASVRQLVALLSLRFLILVGIAVVLALPLGYWGASLWLEEFPYRIAISWWMFALTAAAVLAIAFATVSFQAIKAALANPVESLRDE